MRFLIALSALVALMLGSAAGVAASVYTQHDAWEGSKGPYVDPALGLQPDPKDGSFMVFASPNTSVPISVNQPVGARVQFYTIHTDLAGNKQVVWLNQTNGVLAMAFYAGESSLPLFAFPLDDQICWGNETLALTSGNSTSCVRHDNDSPYPVSVAVADGDCAEGGNQGSFKLTISGYGGIQPFPVSFSVSGTATSGADYAALGTSRSVLLNNPSSSLIVVDPVDDGIFEGLETVTITLQPAVNYSVTGSPATLSIRSTPVVSLAVANAICPENGSAPGSFTVTRDGSKSAPLTVTYAVSGTATNGTDYQTLGGSVTLGAGVASAPIQVVPVNDTAIEANETVTVTLTAQSTYTLGAVAGGSVTIVDDDFPVANVATGANGAEPAVNGSFTFTRGGSLASPLAVGYTVSGSATAGADYQALPGTVNFAAGVSSVAVPVAVIDDTAYEATETVIVSLTASPSYTIGASPTATVLIASDEKIPVTMTLTDGLAIEGTGNRGTIAFSIPSILGGANTVDIALAITGTATAGQDYSALPTMVQIKGATHQATIDISALTDSIVEPSESVIVTILPSTKYAIVGSGTATVWIQDFAGDASQPLAWWKLDDAGGLLARDAGMANDAGTLNGGPAWTAGYHLGGLAFSSAGYQVVTAANPADFSFVQGQSVTLAAWIKPSAVATGAVKVIATKGGSGNWVNYRMALHGTSGGASALEFGLSGGAGHAGILTCDGGSVAPGAWHHVAVSYSFYDQTSIRLYVDGVAVGGTWSSTQAPRSITSVEPLTIGAGPTSGDGGFDGVLDDVRVYRGVVTPAAIQALAAEPPTSGG